jgi:protein TonB
MPRDLFRDAVRRESAGTPRRFWTLPFSLAIHLAILVALVVIPLVASDALPLPRAMMVFSLPTAEPPHVPAGPPPPRVASLARELLPSVSLAPVVSPVGLAAEPALTPMAEIFSGERVPGGLQDVLEGAAPLVAVPPPPPVRPAAPLPIGGDITRPTKLVDVRPTYPQTALLAHVEGLVIIEATIGTNGEVTNARVLRSIALLDDAALAGVRQWRYTPTLLNGVPVSVYMTVTVRFSLR